MNEHGLTFVTVVFEAEVLLLQLQARSMSVHLSPALVREIVVIDNSAHGLGASDIAWLMQAYGDLAPVVRILRPDEICRVPATIGWRSQQVLKLGVADLLSGDRYVVLDAKNHFVSPPLGGFFEATDGRPRASAHSYRAHPLRNDLERVLVYLGLDPAPHLDRFTATVPPFVLDVATVRTVLRELERRGGNDYAGEFVRNDLTEFFLYSGWILSTGQALDDAFDLSRESTPNIWPHAANLRGVDEAIRAATMRNAPLFAVHRTALARLDAASTHALAGFWVDRGLFPTVAEAEQFVAEFTRSFIAARRTKRMRELPVRARDIIRRAVRRSHN